MVGNDVKAISDFGIEVAEHSAILSEHDHKLDCAITEMRVRMDAKENGQK